MKTQSVLLLCLALFSLGAAQQFAPKPVSPRSVKLEKRTVPLVKNGKVQFSLYVPPKSPYAIRNGAAEFAGFLSEITGSKITPVNKLPSDPAISVLRYGDKAFAAEKKIALDKIDCDGYVIAAFGNHILIAGSDLIAPKGNQGTIFAGLEFLERFAGVRFYFPGKNGTFIPRKSNWQVPAMTIYDRPDSQYRRIFWKGYGYRFQKWYEPVANQDKSENIHHRRLRMSTASLPNCHGLAYLNYVGRFAKTHPEYFSVKPNGQRADGSVVRVPSDKSGHLCFSSNIMEEIYQDAKAVLTGPEAIAKRNMKGYAQWAHNKPFFNLMPNDSMGRCRCEKCKPYFEGHTEGGGYTDKAAAFLWKKLLTVPNRLKKEGVPGFVTMMAYDLCRNVPADPIPDNVIMQVAHTGAWKELQPESQRKDEEILKQWVKKINKKIYLWNYSTKYNVRHLPAVPNFTPKAIGSYYKRMYKYSFGTFLEAESDYWFFGHLNFYVFSKVMWDHTTDVDKLLDEYRTLMFGKGAAPMKTVMEDLERHWLKNIVGNTIETSVGPASAPPSEHRLWTKIFSTQEIKRINALFDKAVRLAGKDKAAVERIKFFRTALWKPTEDAAASYFRKAAAVEHWKSDMGLLKKGEKILIDGKGDDAPWKEAPYISLIGLKKDFVEVHTTVKMLADEENFYFLFDCREPLTDKMRREKRPFDSKDMWMDNAIEIHLDPAGKRQEDFQIMIDSYGAVADLHIKVNPLSSNWKWNSGAVAKTTLLPGKGWFVEVKVPRKNMTAVKGNTLVANFNRNRVINGVKVHPYYTWSPHALSFGDIANFGTLHLGKSVSKNLVTDLGFANTAIKGNKKSGWFNWGYLPARDTQYFRTKGVSIRLEGKKNDLVHRMPMLKPNTLYRLSFFVRQENITPLPGKNPKWCGFHVRLDDGNGVARYFPTNRVFGSLPWTRWEHTYRTSNKPLGTNYKPYIHFTIGGASGKVWFDQVEFVEVPEGNKK